MNCPRIETRNLPLETIKGLAALLMSDFYKLKAEKMRLLTTTDLKINTLRLSQLKGSQAALMKEYYKIQRFVDREN